MTPFAITIRSAAALLLALLLGLAPLPAQAHKLLLFASSQGKTISGFAYFPGGGKYAHGLVAIYDEQERHITDLTANQEGAFTFAVPSPGLYRLVATTPDGHAARFTVQAGTNASLPAAELPLENRDFPPSAVADLSALEELVDRAVARQLLPLREELARSGQETRLRDIIGGIGYITGLFGLAAYLLARRSRRGKSAPPLS
jgi:nickel transport protein